MYSNGRMKKLFPYLQPGNVPDLVKQWIYVLIGPWLAIKTSITELSIFDKFKVYVAPQTRPLTNSTVALIASRSHPLYPPIILRTSTTSRCPRSDGVETRSPLRAAMEAARASKFNSKLRANYLASRIMKWKSNICRGEPMHCRRSREVH